MTLRVIVAEVNRAAARTIGINFTLTEDDGTVLFSNTTGGPLTPNISFFTGNNFSLSLQALRTLSYARSLAEPNLTALNGQTASFQSGGQFPVPVVDHNGIFQGWATFHVTSADGASQKVVRGYFVSPFLSARLTVGGCAAGTCPRYLGTYALHLVD